MNNREEEFVASFMVVDNSHQIRRVVVSQDRFISHSGETIHSKNLSLENINGQEVYRTEDPDIFKLIDGTTLKRRGHFSIRMNDCPSGGGYRGGGGDRFLRFRRLIKKLTNGDILLGELQSKGGYHE